MPTLNPKSPKSSPLSKEDRIRLMSEMATPYRGLRMFIYFAAASSAGIGAFVFFFRVLAGRDLGTTLPNLALQVGVLAAMVGLIKWERSNEDRQRQRFRDRLD